jgi:hypothetical protein
MREKVPAQSAISDCKAANWSSSGAGFVGTGNEGCHPAGACTVAAGAVVAGWRSCSSNSLLSNSWSFASSSSWKR